MKRENEGNFIARENEVIGKGQVKASSEGPFLRVLFIWRKAFSRPKKRCSSLQETAGNTDGDKSVGTGKWLEIGQNRTNKNPTKIQDYIKTIAPAIFSYFIIILSLY